MDQERWQRIEDLLEQALALAPGARAEFLTRVCDGDAELRREVEQQIGAESKIRIFIEEPAIVRVAAQFAESPNEALIGQQVGHYQILALLGQGGMGRVYKAWDIKHTRLVALKTVPAAVASDAERGRRFEQEWRALVRLNHPNIITIYETTEDDGAHFIVQELVEGQTLRQYLTDPITQQPKQLSAEEAVKLAIPIAHTLAAAHTAGVIHRDIKPENIMLRADGVVKVLDFGIAKLEVEMRVRESGRDREAHLPALPFPHSSTLTSPGTILGTASYMSPEQARGESLDVRTDIFSLGVTLYEMVMGERLFVGAALAGANTALKGEQEPLRPEAKFEHSAKELERIIRKALRRKREERYASAGELLSELNALKHQLANRASRRMVKLGALALLLAALFVAVSAWLSLNVTWEERVLRDGHTAPVYAVAFSPDGRQLLSGEHDHSVRLYTRRRTLWGWRLD
jgi:eukaryotic-like serine/threonine-protein kinase